MIPSWCGWKTNNGPESYKPTWILFLCDGQTNYSAAKAGVIGATKALAQEVGRHGITVNAVAPGFIRTDMTEALDEKEMKILIPVRRFGLPEEVAHAVGFLASPRAAYVTAEVLSINGGLYS